MNSFAGIYEIKNLVNGKRYLGGSVCTLRRIKDHQLNLKKNNHVNSILQRAWNKYGKDNFIFSVLLYCDKNRVGYFEQACLDNLNPEYNIAKDARAPMRGIKFTDEHKKKISEKLKGNTNGAFCQWTDEQRRAISERTKGVSYGPLSDEHKKKLSSALKGKKWNPEHRQRAIDGIKKYYATHDVHLSDEHKQKLSIAGKGRVRPEEERKKISDGLRRYWAEKKGTA